MNIHEKLLCIQKKLKTPKSQFNTFGKYYYRNCEDILEAVKPLLQDCTLYIWDAIEQVGDRYYVRACVEFCSEGEKITATAYAREEQDKKGMDGAQITGAASSYARKYALNGLFLIDDTKDADSGDNTKKGMKEPPPEPESLKNEASSQAAEGKQAPQRIALEIKIKDEGIDREDFKKYLSSVDWLKIREDGSLSMKDLSDENVEKLLKPGNWKQSMAGFSRYLDAKDRG